MPNVKKSSGRRVFGAAIRTCATVWLLASGMARADSVHEGAFWGGYMSSWWLDPQWALWFDTHLNTQAFYVLRGGVTRAFEAGPSVTGGYAFLLLNPDFERQEHRPWAQVAWPLRLNDDWSFSQRLRTDFRVQQSVDAGEITSGWDFTFRARYQSTFTYRFPKVRIGTPIAQVGNEVLVDLGSTEEDVGLDQNRASAMLGIELASLTVRVGYMDRYLPGRAGSAGTHEHNAVVWFTHHIDLDLDQGAPREAPESGGP